jgi:pimeloyl-ACP methyl ester carboxylesterase
MMPLFPYVLLAMLAGCSIIPSASERVANADAIAGARGWVSKRVPTPNFQLIAYLPKQLEASENLTVYLEGDGFAWLSSSQPSADPTPRDPLALKLALAQPAGAAVYLARPCQYIDGERQGCDVRYWTESRFSPEVVSAMNVAVDALKLRFSAKRLTLVGYSGGGAIAALLAARRPDVERLITVAGNLDHVAWTREHRLRPLEGSLNPADEIGGLASVEQIHFVGGKDTNIQPKFAAAFANRFTASKRPQVTIFENYDHRCCWVENWQQIWLSVSDQNRPK